MAEDGGTQAHGTLPDAEDALDERRDEGEGEAEDASETEDESGTDDESGSEESESESESDSEQETASGTDTESGTETEAETSGTERTTGAGDDRTPRAQYPQPVDDAQPLTPPPADDGVEPLPPMQKGDDAQPADAQPVEDDAPAPEPASSWSLPPAPSRGSSREGILSSHQQALGAEDARASGTESLQLGQGEAVPFSLPPAVSRNGSRECSRKSSHHEASTSGSGLPQSPSSLPPINPRSNPQPSRKGSTASTSGAPARRSQAPSPKQGSPSRNPIAAPRHYHPPPPPPPLPKPKPRERHDVSAVDPIFLQTAVYRIGPTGRVYDWKLQHEVNAALSKQRKQQVQTEKVLDAARIQLQVRDANERAFQQWVAAKEQEKQQQHQQNRRIAYVTSVYQNLLKEDPLECRARESLWVSNFACPTAGVGLAPRERISEDSERFRL